MPAAVHLRPAACCWKHRAGCSSARTATAARSRRWPRAACSTNCSARGVKHVFYFQVDNPLVKMCDPGFVGRHIATRSEASSKVVFKEDPKEKVGIFAVWSTAAAGSIEYSDLPAELAEARDPTARCGSAPATRPSTCSRSTFLERLTSDRRLAVPRRAQEGAALRPRDRHARRPRPEGTP